MNWNNVSFLPIVGKNICNKQVFENHCTWMSFRVSTNFNHLNWNPIMTMCFTYSKALISFLTSLLTKQIVFDTSVNLLRQAIKSCEMLYHAHCVKCVQIWSFFYYVFSCIRVGTNSVLIQKNTDQKKLRIWTLFPQWRLPQLSYIHKFLRFNVNYN